MKGLAARLHETRTVLGLTQADVAEAAGLPVSAICHFESGRRAPSIGNFRKLVVALGVTADSLLETGDSEAEALSREVAHINERLEKPVRDGHPIWDNVEPRDPEGKEET